MAWLWCSFVRPPVQLVVLVSRVSSDAHMKANQDRLIQMLQGRGYELEFIDGADRELKELRDRLFEISGHRAKYPQVFQIPQDTSLLDASGYTFLGLFPRFLAANENEDERGTLTRLLRGVPCSRRRHHVPRVAKAADTDAAAPVTPAGTSAWEEHHDEDGNPFFFNADTDEVTWIRPRELGGTGAQWTMFVHDDKVPFYYNAVTGETTWERPPDFDGEEIPGVVVDSAERPGDDAAEDGGSLPNGVAGAHQTRALPEGWVAHEDSYGRQFYSHEESGVTQWEFPER